MMHLFTSRRLLIILLLTITSLEVTAQTKDSLLQVNPATTVVAEVDTTRGKETIKKVKVYSPRKAAIRSAVLPGWGQIYNKKYWKLPLVYGALGITGYIFVDNIKTYREYRFAYAARYKAALPAGQGRDSTDYFRIEDRYKRYQPESIRNARDQFRQYIDYSVLFFVLFWGLNVVDATVDAHLKAFDVSPDLSLQFKPGRSQMAGTNGMSIVLNIGTNKPSPRLRSLF